MKILKIVGIILGGLIGLFLLIPAFLPSGYSVERSIEINKSVAETYPKVINFDQFIKWDPWSPQDPQSETALTGTIGEVGSKWAWNGKIVGKGSMTLTSKEPEKQATFKLQFDEPMESVSENNFIFESLGEKTKVIWRMKGETGYFARYMNPMMDGMIGKDFEKGLQNLKEFCEK